MKISMHTLGCPNWDLATVITRAREYGFDGIEFRGLQSSIDITTLPEFTTHIAETKRMLSNNGMLVAGISTSITVCDATRSTSNLEEAKRTIGLAHELGCVNLRVFGGGDLKDKTREELADVGRQMVGQILTLEGAQELRWLFETHDNWVKTRDCRLLLDCITNSAFGALWDVGHTSRVGEEEPAASYAALGKRIGAVHVKDAIYDPQHKLAMSDGWYYVVPGTGQLPLAAALAVLKQNGFDGWLIFEHEKRWHPELPEPEDVFPEFVQWIRPLIA